MSNTIAVTSELDVINKYTLLVKESLGSESIYIRMKETLDQLSKSGDLKDTEKAKIIADVLTNINNALVSSSMSTALQWASTEKDIALKKLELQKQLDLLDIDKVIKDRQSDGIYYTNIQTQAETRRVLGTPLVDGNGVVTGLSADGKTFEEIRLLQENITNTVEERQVIQANIRQTNAAVQKAIADSYVNYGSYTYDISNNGLTNVTLTSGSYDHLSKIQSSIAKGQANGYTYNAWANALTGVSSMLGTALASGLASSNSNVVNLINKTDSIIDKLNNSVAPY